MIHSADIGPTQDRIARKASGIAVAAVAFTVLATTVAEARPSTRNFTCEGVKDFIYERGAVVMNTKNSSVYRRFVDNGSFCSSGDVTKLFAVPTRTGRCLLKICRPPVGRFFGDD